MVPNIITSLKTRAHEAALCVVNVAPNKTIVFRMAVRPLFRNKGYMSYNRYTTAKSHVVQPAMFA